MSLGHIAVKYTCSYFLWLLIGQQLYVLARPDAICEYIVTEKSRVIEDVYLYLTYTK